VSNDTHIDFSSPPSGVHSAIFDIPWLKTEGSKGAKIVLTDLNDLTSSVPALHHHLAANTNALVGTPYSHLKPMTVVENPLPNQIG